MFVFQFSAIFCIVNILILTQIQIANTEIRKNTFVFHFSTGLCVVVHFPSDRYRSCSLTLPLPPPKNIYHTIIIHAIYYQKYHTISHNYYSHIILSEIHPVSCRLYSVRKCVFGQDLLDLKWIVFVAIFAMAWMYWIGCFGELAGFERHFGRRQLERWNQLRICWGRVEVTHWKHTFGHIIKKLENCNDCNIDKLKKEMLNVQMLKAHT